MNGVAVIIPLYNKASYIKRAINSVLDQTFQDFEVIVVDDGSEDDGAAIVRSISDPRIRLIQQTNKGVSSARNRGVQESNAELVAFLDADDEWFPEHLATILRLKERFPEAGAYATSYVIVGKGQQILESDYQAIPPSPWEGVLPRYFLSSTLGKHPVNSSVLCVKKEVFWEVGGYPIGVSYGEDVDLWGRLAIKYPIAFSWKVGAKYHWDAPNRACISNVPLEQEEFVKTAQAAIFKREVPEVILEDLNEYVNKLELDRAQRNIIAGRPEHARAILLHCATKTQRRRRIELLMLALVPVSVFNGLRRLKNHLFG